MKKFYTETISATGEAFLNHDPSFVAEPPTVAFRMDRELEILDGRRPVTQAGVDALVQSYENEGEFQPILIRVWPTAGGKHAQPPRLIDGAHRYQAKKEKKAATILTLMVECDDAEAEGMEIAANLFRTELASDQSESQRDRYRQLRGEVRRAMVSTLVGEEQQRISQSAGKFPITRTPIRAIALWRKSSV
jgi:hypothetical protein